MRRFWLIITVAGALTACASGQTTPRVPDGAIVFEGRFGTPVFWDYTTSSNWASLPSLVVARARGVYPDAPDVELALACAADGALMISGDAYTIVTDVGGPPPIPSRLGLRTPDVDLHGEPRWSFTGFSQYAAFTLNPTRTELAQLVSGEWLEAYIPFPDGDGGPKYPSPPPDMARSFLKACEALTTAR